MGRRTRPDDEPQTRREFLRDADTQAAASPQLRALAQQYLLARRQNTRDTIGRVAQGAVMGAAGMTPPEREVVDEDLLRASILQQLSEKTQSRARTEAERMAGLADIAAAQEEGNTALLRAIAQVEAATKGAQGTIGAARLRQMTEEMKGLVRTRTQTALNPGEERRIREAAAAAMQYVQPDGTVDHVSMARELAGVMDSLPPEKAGQALGAFFGADGLGQYGEAFRDENRNPIAPRDVMLQMQDAVGADPVLGTIFDRAANAEAVPESEIRRRADEIARESERIGVGSADSLRALREAAGLTPSSRTAGTDRLTDAVLNPEPLPPDEVEQLLMEQLRDLGQAPENLPEFRTKLMATPAFNEFVQQAGYEDSPFGRKQAFKDILTMQKMQGQESRRQQYQGYDREADEAKLGTARSVDVDLAALPEGPRPAMRPAPSAPAPQPAAASVVGGAATTGSAAPRSEPEEEMEEPAQPRRGVQRAVGAIGDALSRAQTAAMSVRGGESEQAPARRPVVESEQEEPRQPVSALGVPLFAPESRAGRITERIRDTIGTQMDTSERAHEALRNPIRATPESEQEPYDEYGESQASTSKQRRQRDLVAALLKRRVA